jgi:RNA polymerase sigma-70 factor (sigma-E family)
MMGVEALMTRERRWAEGDFEVFVATRQRQLLRAAWVLTGSWPAAEDLVQTALARTWRHWDRARRADDPDAYVRRVLVNTYVSGWRRRWRGEVATEVLPDPGTADRTDELALRVSLQAALARLSPRQRAVVALRYVEDLSEEQVAALLGCAVGTVKSTSSKALARLRTDGLLEGAGQ